MPKVMIEGMEMPKSCIDCNLCAWVENENSFVCQPTQAYLGDIEEDNNMYAKYRHKHCPLQEVKE